MKGRVVSVSKDRQRVVVECAPTLLAGNVIYSVIQLWKALEPTACHSFTGDLARLGPGQMRDSERKHYLMTVHALFWIRDDATNVLECEFRAV